MSKQGIDLCYYQGNVNWEQVKTSGISFAIPRDGWGASDIDPKLCEYAKCALEAGVEVPAVYHYIKSASSTADAVQQAKRAIANVKDAGLPKSTIIWVDIEQGSVTDDSLIKPVAKAFCDYVLSQGYPTGIYTSQSYVAYVYGEDILNEYDIWLADYEGEPGYKCVYRQTGTNPDIPGIGVLCDVDVYLGQYTAGTAKPKTEEKTVSEYQIMTDKEFVDRLKTLARGKSVYKNWFPYNLLYWDGERFSADCHNLLKALFNGRDITDKTVGSFAFPLTATGDCTEYGLLQQCADITWNNFKTLKAGEPRMLYMDGHAGAYLGEEWTEAGQGVVNCVECTPRWEDGIQFSYIDTQTGGRSWAKGTANCGYWEAHGLCSKWVVYSDEAVQETVEEEVITGEPEAQKPGYNTSDLAVAFIRGQFGNGYENRLNNCLAQGYTADEVRAAQDLVNKVVKKVNAEKLAAEQALTVITAAYDVIAGKYGDGTARKTALIAEYGEEIANLIQAKVEELLS